MSRLVVDLERLAELVDRLEVFGAHLERTRAESDARVRQVQVEWTGAAAAAQATAQARWDSGAEEVHQALVALRAIATTAHANYCAAVVANRRMWAS